MSGGIVRRFSAVFGSKLGVLLFTIVTTPILTRLLGTDGYGDYAFLLSTLQWLLVFVYAGTFDGVRKYVAEDRDADGWADRVFAFYVRLSATIATFVVVFVVVLAHVRFVSTLGPNFTRYFLLLAAIVPVKAMFRIARGGLMGLELEASSEPLLIVDRALFLAAILVISLTGGGLAAVLLGRLLGLIVAMGLAFALLSRWVDLSTVLQRSVVDVPRARLARYSLSTMALSFLVVSLYHVDVILLRILVGDSAAGLYRGALVVAEFLWFAPIAVQLVLLQSTSKLWVENRYDRLSEIGSRAVRYTLLCTALLVLGIASLAEPFLTLYFGPAFDAAVTPLLLLLPGALGFAIARPVFAINRGQENLRLLIAVTAVAAVMNVALNLVLIPRYGASGAAVATSAAYSSMFGLHVWSARQLGFDPLADLRPVRIGSTVLIAAVPILILPSLLSSDALSLVVVPPIGAATFAAAAFATGAVRRRELAQLIAQSPFSSETITERLPD